MLRNSAINKRKRGFTSNNKNKKRLTKILNVFVIFFQRNFDEGFNFSSCRSSGSDWKWIDKRPEDDDDWRNVSGKKVWKVSEKVFVNMESFSAGANPLANERISLRNQPGSPQHPPSLLVSVLQRR